MIVDPESKLEEEIIIRPTSETVIWSMYKKWIHSYRDLPVLINQWANVVRMEMRTRLFLRTSEFLWQEGHTAHHSQDEAKKESLLILEFYRKLVEEHLAVPVYTGIKTESEKFAGADTYTIEAMMGDKRALQAGTSHNLGQNFAKAFNVTYQTKDNREEHVWATSWGVSTRLIGAVILTHGDEKGLRLPPKIAPIQLVIIPITKTKEESKSLKLYLAPIINSLKMLQIRFHEDWSSNSPGFKFNEWEMKGVPLRLEIGPRDMANNTLVLARRDNKKKIEINQSSVGEEVSKLLDEIQSGLFNQAEKFRNENTRCVSDYNDFKKDHEKRWFCTLWVGWIRIYRS